MIIKYGKVKLRAVEFEDLDMLREMMNDPDIESNIGGFSYPISKTQQEQWFENLKNNKNELRLIIDVANNGAIGTIILTDIDWKNRTAEINTKIINKSETRGQGYGTFARIALLKYAFEQLNLHCVYSRVLEYNEISKHINLKLGYRHEGTLRERVYKNGKYNALEIYSMLKGELIEPRDR